MAFARSNLENENKMFGPLVFKDTSQYDSSLVDAKVSCLLCEDMFNLVSEFDIFVKHMFEMHNLVIEEVQNIKNLPEYMEYWRGRFKTSSIEEIVPAVKVSSSDHVYFLLSTLLNEDKKLRHKLSLEDALKVQEFERTDTTYTKSCLFCKLKFEGTRTEFITHLVSQHNLQLGNPQNLVYIDEMISKIEQTLNELVCLYCNKVFPERNILKEHMRKKLHKRLNRKNKEYDKYFIINYLEADKGFKKTAKESDDRTLVNTDEEPNKDEEYYDWNEKEDSITCLFCEKKETNINTLCLHMEADHDFDFSEETKDFDFYQKVKFVNYVRRQIHEKKCLYCDLKCTSAEALREHLFGESHCKLPKHEIFDQPEFYFPTYENDAFLYLIDDVED